jgi:hypothetical protein
MWFCCSWCTLAFLEAEGALRSSVRVLFRGLFLDILAPCPKINHLTRDARFFFVQDTKMVKYAPIPKIVPNGHKIYQIATKYTKW